jgi:hypothetical protein
VNLHVEVDGVDVTTLAQFYDTQIIKNATESISTARIVFISDPSRDAVYDESLYDQSIYSFEAQEMMEVILTDDDSNRHFAGVITTIEMEIASGRIMRRICNCSDYSIFLTRAVVSVGFTGLSDKDVILQATNGLDLGPVNVASGNISEILTDIGDIIESDVTIRELLDIVCGLSGGAWRVDSDGELLYYQRGSLFAPFAISDNPNSITSFPHIITRLTRDFSRGANHITVLGEFPISATSEDTQSQALYGLQKAVVVDRNLTTTYNCQLRADAEVLERSFPAINGLAETWKDGLNIGETLTVQNSAVSIFGVFEILSITITFHRKGDTVYPDGVEYRAKYQVEFGKRLSTLESTLRMIDKKQRQFSRLLV